MAKDESDRVAVLAELLRRQPLVIHTFEDGLTMAQVCEALWPGRSYNQHPQSRRKAPRANGQFLKASVYRRR
jgi:hypothetical protein